MMLRHSSAAVDSLRFARCCNKVLMGLWVQGFGQKLIASSALQDLEYIVIAIVFGLQLVNQFLNGFQAHFLS